MTSRSFFLSLALSLGALAGCGRSFVAATPPGFVDLGDRYGKDEYRATTADGVVLGVRAMPNDPKGERAFWTRAIENQMRELGGYALLGRRDVKNRSGMVGEQLRFGHDDHGQPALYYLTIFVTDDRIYLVEAGGPKAQVERFEPQLEWAAVNLWPR